MDDNPAFEEWWRQNWCAGGDYSDYRDLALKAWMAATEHADLVNKVFDASTNKVIADLVAEIETLRTTQTTQGDK